MPPRLRQPIPLALLACLLLTPCAQAADPADPTTRPGVADLVLRLRHGSPDQQELAARDLQLILGDAAGRVFASSLPDAEWLSPARGHLRAALVGWRTADPARYLLDNPEPDAPARALAALNEAARTDPAGFASLDPDAVMDLVDGLEELARTDPPDTPALQLLARIAADPRPGVWLIDRARAARLASDALIARSRNPEALARAAVAVAAPDVAPPAEPPLIPPGTLLAFRRPDKPHVEPPAELPADTDLSRPEIADFVAGQIAFGNPAALPRIKGNDANTKAFLTAAARYLSEISDLDVKLNLARAVREVATTQQVEERAELRHHLAQLLVPPKDAPADQGGLRFKPPRATPDQLAVAAAPLLTGPLARAEAQDKIVTAIAGGQTVPAAALQALKLNPHDFAPRLTPHLKNGSAESRRAAAAALAAVTVPADDAPTRAALDTCLRSDDDALRTLAADALNTPQARDLARLPNLLRDLRANNPAVRSLAARQIQSLNVEPPDVTAALVRATDARDMPAREGLCLALERAFATAHPTRDVLATLAAPTNPDPATRACAKAALRTIDPQR